MNIGAFLCRAALLAVLPSGIVFAQVPQFQPPNPDELKMTADPKAPGASAIYLDLQETVDDNLHARTYYARIKVLTEKGKEWATVEVGHDTADVISAIKARTIHADGTIIPLEGKPADLLMVKSGDTTIKKTVFTMPSVEVGSILEYRYDIDYPEYRVSSPLWEIQRPIYVRKAHYSFTPFKAFLSGIQNDTGMSIMDTRTGEANNNLLWTGKLPPGVSVKTIGFGTLTVDVADVPAAPEEDWMPPLNSFLYREYFFYSGKKSAKQFWDDDAKAWSKEVDRFADDSPPLRAAVEKIVASGDTELAKAKKLFDAVQALENTDYTRTKTESERKVLGQKQAQKAEDVWAQKSGDSEQIAMLYLAMLRSAGLKAYALKVVDRRRNVFDQALLSDRQFDDTIVDLVSGGQEILLDPGEKMCPFKQLSWHHALAGAMRQSPSGPGLIVTADLDHVQNTTLRSGEVTVQPSGVITGVLTVKMTGQEALRWRQTALRNDEAELMKEFDRELGGIVPDGVSAHVSRFVGLETPDDNLVAVVTLGGSIGAPTSKRLILPGFFFESRSNEPFVKQEKRQSPVDMRWGSKDTEQITYHLPGGMTVEGAPVNATEIWGTHGRFIVRAIPSPGQIIVARQVERSLSQVPADQYQDLRGFYQKVAASDQQQLVLHISQEGTVQ